MSPQKFPIALLCAKTASGDVFGTALPLWQFLDHGERRLTSRGQMSTALSRAEKLMGVEGEGGTEGYAVGSGGRQAMFAIQDAPHLNESSARLSLSKLRDPGALSSPIAKLGRHPLPEAFDLSSVGELAAHLDRIDKLGAKLPPTARERQEAAIRQREAADKLRRRRILGGKPDSAPLALLAVTSNYSCPGMSSFMPMFHTSAILVPLRRVVRMHWPARMPTTPEQAEQLRKDFEAAAASVASKAGAKGLKIEPVKGRPPFMEPLDSRWLLGMDFEGPSIHSDNPGAALDASLAPLLALLGPEARIVEGVPELWSTADGMAKMAALAKQDAGLASMIEAADLRLTVKPCAAGSSPPHHPLTPRRASRPGMISSFDPPGDSMEPAKHPTSPIHGPVAILCVQTVAGQSFARLLPLLDLLADEHIPLRSRAAMAMATGKAAGGMGIPRESEGFAVDIDGRQAMVGTFDLRFAGEAAARLALDAIPSKIPSQGAAAFCMPIAAAPVDAAHVRSFLDAAPTQLAAIDEFYEALPPSPEMRREAADKLGRRRLYSAPMEREPIALIGVASEINNRWNERYEGDIVGLTIALPLSELIGFSAHPTDSAQAAALRLAFVEALDAAIERARSPGCEINARLSSRIDAVDRRWALSAQLRGPPIAPGSPREEEEALALAVAPLLAQLGPDARVVRSNAALGPSDLIDAHGALSFASLLGEGSPLASMMEAADMRSTLRAGDSKPATSL